MGFPLALPIGRQTATLTSHGLHSSSFSPKLVLHKRRLCRSQRSSKVMAYYGLTTPPYELDALEPYMSKKTLEVHWGKHHREYVEGLNKHLANSPVLYGYSLDEMVKATYNNGNPLPEFNNAAQVWNHDFFWESMQPDGGNMPWGGLLEQIEKDFGSYIKFRDDFVESAISTFGSGWVWLVCTMSLSSMIKFVVSYCKVSKGSLLQKMQVRPEEKKLAIVRTSNAICPLVWRDIPIISLDMWEHAYYLDYKDNREKYANTFMNHLVSWHAATARIVRAQAFVNLGEPKVPVA